MKNNERRNETAAGQVAGRLTDGSVTAGAPTARTAQEISWIKAMRLARELTGYLQNMEFKALEDPRNDAGEATNEVSLIRCARDAAEITCERIEEMEGAPYEQSK